MEAISQLMPECPLSCVVSALFESSCASDPTSACLCTNEAFSGAATACITSTCSIRDGLTAKNLTLNLCGKGPSAHDLTDPTLPISATFLTLAGISVLLRLFSRYHMQAALWWDDLCDVIALLFCIGFVATNMHMIKITDGHDMWFIEFDIITEFLIETYVSFILYILGRSVIRFSIIFFYMRIFQIRLAKLLLLASFAVNTIFCISATLALACQCTPVNYFWLRWDGEHEGECISAKSLVWALAVLAFAFDLWLIVLPIPFITRLKLSWQKKAQTSVMFVIGIAVLVVSAFRFTTITKFTTSKNPTMDSMATGLTSALELEIGIICASLPSIQVLFKPMLNRAFGWTQGSIGGAASYQLRDEAGDSKRGSKLGVSSLGGIRLTTTIRQEAPTPNESETYLPLQDFSDGKETMNFSPVRKGVVKSEAWA